MPFIKTNILENENVVDAKAEYHVGKQQEMDALRALIYDGSFVDEQMLRLEGRKASLMIEIEHRDRGQGAVYWIRLMGRLDAINETLKSVREMYLASGRAKQSTPKPPNQTEWLIRSVSDLQDSVLKILDVAENLQARVEKLETKT